MAQYITACWVLFSWIVGNIPGVILLPYDNPGMRIFTEKSIALWVMQVMVSLKQSVVVGQALTSIHTNTHKSAYAL
jgi:hypothetical protein